MIEQYWDFWWGGLAIAAVAVSAVLLSGRFIGITRGYAGLCSLLSKHTYFRSEEVGGAFGYRSLFAVGLLLGGFAAALSNGGWHPSFALGKFDEIFGQSLAVKAGVLIAGGFFWGLGSRLAGGCTSGNSIAGLSKGSLASLVATLCFLIAGAAVTYLLNFLMGAL